MYRHNPAIRKLEELIKAGGIGEVDNVRAEFGWWDAETETGNDKNRNWRQRKECGGGVPYDAACYAVNAAGHFCGGLPVRVMASGTISPVYGTISRLFGIIEYDNGKTAMVASSKKQEFVEDLQIEGSKGILRLPLAWTILKEVSITKSSMKGWADIVNMDYSIPVTDSYMKQLENFAAVIDGEEDPVLPLAESVANTRVIEALVKSIETGSPVTLSLR